MTDQKNDNTAPAREALASWDKLHNERETLNGNLDFSNDAAYHQPEGKVTAETVRELATAAILLEQTNTLLDRVNERQPRRPAVADEAEEIREEIADTILAKARRKGFTVQCSDGKFPYQLVGPKVTVEGLAEQVAELDGARGSGTNLLIEPISSASTLDDQPERFAIPEMLGERRADQDRWVHDVYTAGLDHAKHLRKAESRLAKAKGLAETLRCALLSDRYDPEPFADDVVAAIIDHISEVQEQIDRHGSRHSNLFLAYFDKAEKLPEVNSLKELGELPIESGKKGADRGTFSALATFQARCEKMPIDQVTLELRRHNWEAYEDMAASIEQDGYMVRKTWTRKGLRYFLADLMFLESLLPDEGGAA